jgi:Tol biopolymer transport system component/predicted Ser/Thr protein kinase
VTTPLERLSTALADRYLINRELGAGGMATVYLASDIRHDRKVAIKVLRPELAAVIGADRFLGEIRTTANLNHPNILPLFDSGEADSFLFYVMPYVEGETLRDRLNREKQLSIAEAVRIASEVAAALDYAHRHGVIHRDIKPANVLFHDGRALVADFGIALAASRAVGGRMTETGMSLGTPQYMSPEQAMGEREITARSDVYSLGAMTYEMLIGEPPHTGPTAQAIVAKVLTADPKPLRTERRSIPENVEQAVLTALEKLPADRFATAAEFAEALSEEGATSGVVRARARSARAGAMRGRVGPENVRRSSLMAGLLLLLLLTGVGGWMLNASLRHTPPAAPVRMAFTLGQPAVDRPFIEISPDGRRVIQVAADSDGLRRIVMRDLGSTRIIAIPGTEGAVDPIFSLDGEWISFISEGKLRKVPALGGPPVDLADSASVAGGWTPDGSIVFTRDGKGLWIVPSAGGPARQLTTLDTKRKEFNQWYPEVLPGGEAMIYTSYTTPISRARIEAYDFKTHRKTVLVEGAVYGKYAESGHLLYARDGAIFAVPFDAASLKVLGTPVPVEEDVDWTATDALGSYAVSKNGTLAYLKASEWNVDRRVVWADRTGREEPALPRAGPFAEPRLSPDGKWIAITVTVPRREIWLYEVGRSALTRLSRTDNAAFNAVWTPDSRSIIYSHEDPVYDLHQIPIDGSAQDKPLITSAWDKYAYAISPDGRSLAYIENNTIDRLMLAAMDGTGVPKSLSTNAIAQRGASFSPNGRWIAYEELAHGRPNIFITTSDGSGGRRQVSVDGGEQPRWSSHGREIVFRKGEAMMAAPVEPNTGDVGKPVQLFRKTQPDRLGIGRTYTYDVVPDGSRFLLVLPNHRAGAQPAVVVLNWFEQLKAKSRRDR